MTGAALVGSSSVASSADGHSVGIVIVSHSFSLAKGVLELARQMAGPDTRIVAVGGLPLPDHPLGTDAHQIATAIESVYSDDGVVVLLDVGSALLSASVALDLLPADHRANVHLCEAPLVEGAIAAAVQARLGSPVDRVLDEAKDALRPKIEQLRTSSEEVAGQVGASPFRGSTAEPPSADGSPTRELRMVVRNRHGLHARPAARLVQAAASHGASVQLSDLTSRRGPVDARSLTDVATLGVLQNHEFVVSATGPDAEATLAEIQSLANANFGDLDEDSAPTSTNPVQPSGQDNIFGPTRLNGVAASPGIAVARVQRLRFDAPDNTNRPVPDPNAVWSDLSAAIERVRLQIEATRNSVDRNVDAAPIFDVQLRLLEDPALVDPCREAIFERGLSAATAWRQAVALVSARYRAVNDEYLRARAADVDDVGRQVSKELTGSVAQLPAGFDAPTVVIAAELGPSEVARLARAGVAGIGLALGGPTSHASIVARALGIPLVVGLGPEALSIEDGATVVLDGGSGTLLPEPDSETIDRYRHASDAERLETEEARANRGLPASTRDGQTVAVLANVGGLADAGAAASSGADGIGLLRTEIWFMAQNQLPSEDEQVRTYSAIADLFGGRPVTIRTLDLGGDKPLRNPAGDPTPGLPTSGRIPSRPGPIPPSRTEENPALGVRGLRWCIAHPDVFVTQLRAIVRAAAGRRLRVVFPMVATSDELRAARSALDEARLAVERAGLPTPVRIAVGIMIEVPAAALRAADFADDVDFFSIGTNDLAQYVFAADRGNPVVSPLTDALHPSILELIARVVDVAHSRKKTVAVCGELAADALATPILVGLGVDELSVNSASIATVKQAIRTLTCRQARSLARRAKGARSASEVRELCRTASR